MPRRPDPRRAKVIRPGDNVRIVVPDFFVRCGYPKSIETETEIVREKFSAIIRGMIKDPAGDDRLNLTRANLPAAEAVLKAVAYARLRTNGFGGGTRIIHSKRDEALLGKEFAVSGVFFCKTGEYQPPSSSNGGYYGDDYDYEPGYLDQAKTHKILDLHYLPDTTRSNILEGMPLRIDAANVEKVMTPDYG